MIFSSNIFIFLFLPITLAVYFLISKLTNRNTIILNFTLIVFSLFFYLWGSGSFIFIFVLSVIVNYFLGKAIYTTSKTKLLIFLGIFFNLGLLFYFKYFNFFYQQLSFVLTSYFHIKLSKIPGIFLPIGISFYTFMAISYLLDIYRKRITPVSLSKFATYLTLFPHIVAGPIVRYNDIGKEINVRKVDTNIFFDGLVRFSFGLGKKVIIANSLGIVVDKIFSLPISELSFLLAWIGIILYTFQIYYDFSGYSDMAIGLAKFFGFNFPENFDRPYISSSITEFWRRWHMTLSSWLKDYLYIPLGGNRKGNLRTYTNLFIVFFLCGLWHGASWTFVIWGIYHATLLIIERFLKNNFNFKPKGTFWIITTFILLMMGWVMFRSPSIEYSFLYFKRLFSLENIYFISTYYKLSYYLPINIVAYSIIAAVFSFIKFPNYNNYLIKGVGVILILLYSFSLLAKTSFTPFIYFQF